MNFDLHEWHTKKQYGDILLDYLGDITPESIAESMQTLEAQLNDDTIKLPLRKKVYQVAI